MGQLASLFYCPRSKCKADPADATKPRLPDTPFVLFGKGSSAAGVRPA